MDRALHLHFQRRAELSIGRTEMASCVAITYGVAGDAEFLLSDLMTAASQQLRLPLRRPGARPLPRDCCVLLKAEEMANTNAVVGTAELVAPANSTAGWVGATWSVGCGAPSNGA